MASLAPATGRRLVTSAPLILLLCGVILYLRKPDQFSHPQFWAEDGSFYLTHFLRGWHTLIEPYAGYLNVTLWLIAGTAWWWHPAVAPAWFVGCAFLITLYVAARALSPRQPWGGAIVALAVVLVPDAFEVLLNGANIQWIISAGFVLLLLSRDPATAAEGVHDLLASLLSGLTGPFSILLTPLFLERAWQRKTAWSWALAMVVTGTALIQMGFILHSTESLAPAVSVHVIDLLGVVGTRLGGSLLTGGRITDASALALRSLLAVLTVAWVVGTGLRRGPARRQRLYLATALLLMLAAGIYRCRQDLVGLQRPVGAARYFFPLQLMMLWLLASALGDPRRAWRWTAGGVLVLCLGANLGRLREPALPDLHWAGYAAKIRAGEAVTIRLNPVPMSIAFPVHKPL